MHFSTAFLIPLLSLTQAVIIPADTPDGLVSLDTSGSGAKVKVRVLARHEDFDAMAARSPVGGGAAAAKAPFVANVHNRRDVHLPVTDSGCFNDWVDPADWTLARARFNQACDAGTKIAPHSVLAYKVGSVIAYGCSYGNDNPCDSQEYNSFDNWLTNTCGNSLTTGFVWMNDWAKVYGRDLITSDVCNTV